MTQNVVGGGVVVLKTKIREERAHQDNLFFFCFLFVCLFVFLLLTMRCCSLQSQVKSVKRLRHVAVGYEVRV